MKAPRHIQEALDREFPGVRLEWNPLLCWWILTEDARWPNGMPARNAWIPRTGLLRGIEPWEWSHRKPTLFWGVIEEGIKHPLSLFAILDSLRKYRKGTRVRDAEDSIDALESREQDAADRLQRQRRDAAMDRAKDVWKDMHQSMFGRYVRKTDVSHTRAVNEEHARRERELQGDQGDADAEVARRMRSGHGIAAARRERKAEVAT